MNIDLKNLTIEKAHEALQRGDYTVTELVTEYLKVIKEKNSDINAYLEVYNDTLSQAKVAEAMFKNGSATMLTGIPIALKDNILFKGHISSSGSKMLESYHATYDAGVVKQLKEKGAVFLGRVNMDEFAMGSSTENSAYGVTKNPLDTTCVPGGSSGGSAAAVAMNGALIALGTDTGGSVRLPSAFCGTVGFKPTYGAVSRSGVVSMGSSFDQVGPLGKSVADVEILFKAMNDYDASDSTSIPKEKRIFENKFKKRLGVPEGFLSGEGVDKEVVDNFNESCQKLKDVGYEIVEIPLPILVKYSLAVYYILVPAEISSNLARYDGIRYGLSADAKNLLEVYTKSRGKGFGKEVRRRIILGTYILSHGYYDAYYNKALAVRSAIIQELDKAFLDVDAIITPTSPFPAWKFGEKSHDPLSAYLADIYTVTANLAYLPAMSIPSGKNSSGLPLGLQIMAPKFKEEFIFKIGKDFEKLV